MFKNAYIFLCIVFFILGCEQPKEVEPTILPVPQDVVMQSGTLDLSKGFKIEIKNEELNTLKPIIKTDYNLLYNSNWTESETTLILDIDTTLEKEAYTFTVNNTIEITGGSYGAVALALSTFWQAVSADNKLPKMTIKDGPDYNYRSIMLDVARAWHSPETIKTIIDLCRWYKINYLHLHLTDDSAFSFPSDAFPELATKNHAYTKAELVALNEYAYNRGVILVPEIDIPGHSSKFIKEMPELFGIAKVEKNPYTINMGKESVYKALDTIMGEVAEVFTYSPFIHIGGDEAFFEGMEDDPDIKAYIKEHNLPNMHELFLHFLIRMNDIVKSKNKQTIVWAGFGEKGDLTIPKDVIVLNWNHLHHSAKDLLNKEYPIVNASFKPLYVVNNRKWEAEYIYNQWNPNRWESWTNKGDFSGEELEPNNLVMGGTLCAWEQSQINQMPRLRHRAASMAQHLWSKPTDSWPVFYEKQQQTDKKLSTLTLPFAVHLKGLMYPELKEGNFYEHLWFGDTLEISMTPNLSNITLQYALTKTPKVEDWKIVSKSLTLVETQPVHIRAINNNGELVGGHYFQKFYYKPMEVTVKGLWENLPIGSWEKYSFQDTLQIALSTALKNHSIRYNTNGERVTLDSKLYTDTILETNTTRLSVQLFDKDNKPVGSSFNSTYFKIWNEKSLTTGKPISASDDYVTPNGAAPANNGRISLWDMWGKRLSDENWVKVDLETVETITRFKVYTFWDNYRYYQYTIEGSLDGETWFTMVDFSENKQLATNKGVEHKIMPTQARFVRIDMLYNSANPGVHLVEFGAFSD